MEEKRRQKEEQKRRELDEAMREEERIAKDRKQLEEEFLRE